MVSLTDLLTGIMSLGKEFVDAAQLLGQMQIKKNNHRHVCGVAAIIN